jgi:hypothetical protein
VVNPIGGDTAQPLSGNMNFLLMLFGDGSGATNRTGSASGTGGTSGSGSETQTAGAPDDTSAASAAQGGASQASLLADLQSLLSSLGGNRPSAINPNGTGTAGTSSTPSPNGATSTGTASTGTASTGTASTGTASTGTASTGTASIGNSLPRDLDSIPPDLGTVVASTGGSPPPPGGAGGGWPGGGRADAIGNPGTASAEPAWRQNWDAIPGGGWQQHYGLAAYASGGQSGTSSATTAALQNITA